MTFGNLAIFAINDDTNFELTQELACLTTKENKQASDIIIPLAAIID